MTPVRRSPVALSVKSRMRMVPSHASASPASTMSFFSRTSEVQVVRIPLALGEKVQ
jgi:hypothetical protein